MEGVGNACRTLMLIWGDVWRLCGFAFCSDIVGNAVLISRIVSLPPPLSPRLLARTTAAKYDLCKLPDDVRRIFVDSKQINARTRFSTSNSI